MLSWIPSVASPEDAICFGGEELINEFLLGE